MILHLWCKILWVVEIFFNKKSFELYVFIWILIFAPERLLYVSTTKVFWPNFQNHQFRMFLKNSTMKLFQVCCRNWIFWLHRVSNRCLEILQWIWFQNLIFFKVNLLHNLNVVKKNFAPLAQNFRVVEIIYFMDLI